MHVIVINILRAFIKNPVKWTYYIKMKRGGAKMIILWIIMGLVFWITGGLVKSLLTSAVLLTFDVILITLEYIPTILLILTILLLFRAVASYFQGNYRGHHKIKNNRNTINNSVKVSKNSSLILTFLALIICLQKLIRLKKYCDFFFHQIPI